VTPMPTKKEHRTTIIDTVRAMWQDPHIQVAHAPHIYVLLTTAHDMHNRPPVARGQVTAVPVTPFMVMLVRQLHQAHPEWNYEQIARATGLDNIGRISEILAGVRT
jgi:hypothetical protein